MSQLRLFLFGSPRLERDGTVRAMDTRKALALLAYLAVTGQAHSRDSLAALFWPDYEQSQARANLRRTLSTLRKAIGKEWLEIDRESIRLVAGTDLWVDVSQFEALLALTRSHDHPPEEVCSVCLSLLTEAHALYQADFLAGFNLADSPNFEEWQFFQSESLRQQVTGVLEKLVHGHGSRGEFEAATAYGRRWVALDPLDETAQYRLMQAYTWAGQRSAALRQYQSVVRVLADELDVAPGEEIETLYQATLKQEGSSRPAGQTSPFVYSGPEHGLLSLPVAPPTRLNNLPRPATPFIGRESELAALTALLADPGCRLLSLVGPGGVGKTRLAIEVAASQQESFADGVCFVPLTPVSNAAFIPLAIADALALSLPNAGDPGAQLVDYLREKRLLLVLDNLEHLLASTGQEITLLSRILHHAPEVKLLATSCERLHLQGEWIFEVHELPVPPPQLLGGYESCSAINLFVQSARRIDSNFKLTPVDYPAVARICQLVHGLPLGIELAAGWVHVLSCQEIAQEIEQSLDFLAAAGRDLPERHRSLRAIFDHSWNLLSLEERRVLGQLSLFQGGFSREAAFQITGASLGTLSSLVDKSLLRRTDAGRYDLHELVWQYATLRLKDDPETLAATRRQHSHYYTSLLASSEAPIKGVQQATVITTLSAEFGNLRLAWDWAITHSRTSELRGAFRTLVVFFEVRNWFQEAVSFFQQAIDGLAAQSPDIPARTAGETRQRQLCLGEMKVGQGFFLFRRGQAWPDPDSAQTDTAATRAIDLLQESLAFLEPLGDRTSLAYAHLCLGIAYYTAGDFQAGRRVLDAGLKISRALGDQWLAAVHLGHLGMIAYTLGEYAEARQRLCDSVALWREVGDIRGLVFNLSIYGMVLAQLGVFDRAQQLLNESLLISSQNNDRWGIANAFNYLGQIALEREPAALEEAFYFLSESATIFRELGARWMLVSVLNNFGQVACNRQDYNQAKEAFLEALDISVTDPILPAAMEALVGLAQVLMQTDEIWRAAEIIGQAADHPATSQHTRDKAKRLQIELESRLSPEQREKLLLTCTPANKIETIASQLLRT